MDGDGSTETESDDNASIDLEALPTPVTPEGAPDISEAHHQYLVARRRWRRLAQRQPRRHRYKGKSSNLKGKGKGKRRHRRSSGWTFLTDDSDVPLCPNCSGVDLDAEAYFGKGKEKAIGATPRDLMGH